MAKAEGKPNPEECVGNPCDLRTGNKYQSVTDYTTAGQNPLTFTRHYNSLADDNDPFAVTLGPRWRSNYDRFFDVLSATEITVARGDGQVLHFRNTGGTWAGDSDIDITLTNDGMTWTLTDSDDTIETYVQLGDGMALLQTITARNGYTQTLDYNSGMQLTSVTDSYGRTLSFTYDDDGHLTQVTTPDTLVLTYAYDAGGMLSSVSYNTTPSTQQVYSYVNGGDLASITDENGNVFASWTYDDEHRALSSQHAGGVEQVTISYDSDTTRTVTNALGQVSTYEFEILQNIPKITTINRTASGTVPAATQTFTYDDNGYMASRTDWNGNVTQYVNDAHGNPVSITKAAGTAEARTTTITYGGVTGRQPVQIVAPRLTTAFTYDAKGNILIRTQTDTSVANGQTRTWAFTWDDTGHMLTATDPRGAVTTYAYDGNNIATVTNALGHKSQITSYNGSGLPLTMVDPSGVETGLAYDVRNRPVSRTIHDGGDDTVTEFAYDAAGNLTALTLPDGTQLLYTYDAAHRVTEVRNSAGEKIAYTLDPLGNIVKQDTSGTTITQTQSAVFDSLGRMLKQIGASGQESAYAYDANSNLLAATDALNNTTTRTFDALDRLIRSTDPLGHATNFAHDAQDNLAAVTDARNLSTTYAYNGFGEVISMTSPDTGTTTYTLDAMGNRVSETDARGIVTNRTFDALNRPLTETYPAAANNNVTYAYDTGDFGKGRLTSVKDASGWTSFAYNARGEIVAEARKIGGKTYTATYARDPAGRIAAVTYPSGRTVAYTRDEAGRIASAELHEQGRAPGWCRYAGHGRFHDWTPARFFHGKFRNKHHGRPGSDGPRGQALVTGITYAPFGPMTNMTFGNGVATLMTYDLDYRLTGIGTQGTGRSAQVLQHLGMAYDATDNITNITDYQASGRTQAFTYDPLYRLLTATGDYGARGYGYDAVGNRTGESFDGGSDAYSYAANANRLLQITGEAPRIFTYDAAGNLITDTITTTAEDPRHPHRDGKRGWGHGHDKHGQGGTTTETRTFTYDSRNRNVSVTIREGRSEKTFRYTYNAFGQRVAKEGVHFIYDLSGNLIAEAEHGRITKEYLYIDSLPVAVIDNNALYYIHTDHLGAPQKMTDARQRVVWDKVSEPFGESDIESRITLNLRFPGQYHDEETGLDYNYFRTYDPSIGRYTQSDPIGLAGGVNTYGYVGQNSVNTIDPFGLMAQDCEGENMLLPHCQQQLLEGGGGGGAKSGGGQSMSFRNAFNKVSKPRAQTTEACPPSVSINNRALKHITERHTTNGGNTANKSVFNKGESITNLIKQGEAVKPSLQTGGNYQRVIDAGRPIGIDRATGQPTSTYTIITDANGNLITAFPGTP